MGMPERIWADTDTWYDKQVYGETPYIRADLAVLATTHQRTLEALEQVLDDSRHGLTMAPATRALALYAYAQSGGTDPDILAGLDAATAMLTEIGHFGSSAALARIKEATDAST